MLLVPVAPAVAHDIPSAHVLGTSSGMRQGKNLKKRAHFLCSGAGSREQQIASQRKLWPVLLLALLAIGGICMVSVQVHCQRRPCLPRRLCGLTESLFMIWF